MKIKYCILFLFLVWQPIITPATPKENRTKINVLILSGRNNHNWEETTPKLVRTLEGSNHFSVAVCNKPDTCSYNYFKQFNAIISNWNSWPENDLRWSEKTEKGFLKYLKKGGGLVTFHASSSAMYEWPDFKKISTGAWTAATWHGKQSKVQIVIENHNHPITTGLSDFSVFDELWVDFEQNNNFQILAYATNDEISEKGLKNQAAIFISNYKKGKIFHTILGHDTIALQNIGLETLILRATEWVATSKVTIPLHE